MAAKKRKPAPKPEPEDDEEEAEDTPGTPLILQEGMNVLSDDILAAMQNTGAAQIAEFQKQTAKMNEQIFGGLTNSQKALGDEVTRMTLISAQKDAQHALDQEKINGLQLDIARLERQSEEAKLERERLHAAHQSKLVDLEREKLAAAKSTQEMKEMMAGLRPLLERGGDALNFIIQQFFNGKLSAAGPALGAAPPPPPAPPAHGLVPSEADIGAWNDAVLEAWALLKPGTKAYLRAAALSAVAGPAAPTVDSTKLKALLTDDLPDELVNRIMGLTGRNAWKKAEDSAEAAKAPPPPN